MDGTVSDVDTEFLHDFRVAVRRSRSAVKLFGDVLPAALVAWVTPQLRLLGDLTTPSRDLDVLLQELPSLTAGLTSGRREDLEPLVLHLTGLACGRAAQTRGRLAVAAVRAVPCTMARLAADTGDLGRAARCGTDRGRGGCGTARPRASSCAPPRLADHGRVACRGPARPAQAGQGAALPAGDLPPDDGWRRSRRGQGAQGLAGRARDVPGQRGPARSALLARHRHDGRRRRLRPDDLRDGGGRRPAAGGQESSRAEFATLFERFARRSAPRRTAPPGPRRTRAGEPATAWQERRGEGGGHVQHQGRRREDVGRGQHRLLRGPRRSADAALGPRPAGLGHLPVPGQAEGQGRRQGAGRRQAHRWTTRSRGPTSTGST